VKYGVIVIILTLLIGVGSFGDVLTEEQIHDIKDILTADTKIISYDDHMGYFSITANGNKGSVVKINCWFSGFYVLPRLTLSGLLQEGLDTEQMEGDWSHAEDVYVIYPKQIRMRMLVNSRAVYEVTTPCDYRKLTKVLNCQQTERVQIADPPQEAANVIAINNWQQQVQDSADKVHCHFRVVSKQARQGNAYVEVVLHIEDINGTTIDDRIEIDYCNPGTNHYHNTHLTNCIASFYAKKDWQVDDTYHFRYSVPLRKAWVNLDSAKDLVLYDAFSLQQMGFKFTGGSPTAWRIHPIKSKAVNVLSDSQYHVSYSMAVGMDTDIKAFLEPVAEDEQDWYPQAIDTQTNEAPVREYKLTLQSPNHADIQAVRFRLLDVSAHEGVATNIGNHALFVNCPDCDLKRQDESYTITTDFHGINHTRKYSHPNACYIDTLPDLFFRDVDNKQEGFELTGEVKQVQTHELTLNNQQLTLPRSQLKYKISDEITLENPDKDDIIAKISCHDYAASATLIAEVKLGGLWYLAQAKGATAMPEERALRIPLDKNLNSIHDAWEKEFNVAAATDDCDGQPNPTQGGDGLTAFEEYRGVFAYGLHERLHPDHKNVFITDQTSKCYAALSELKNDLEKQKLDLMIIDPYEHKDEIINYNSTAYKMGDQYITVISTCCEFFRSHPFASGVAQDFGPPRFGVNVLALKGSTLSYNRDSLSGLIGHELGHLLGMHHHGEKSEIRLLDDNVKYVITCIGSQHSGNFICFMRYLNADLFYDGRQLPDQNKKSLFLPYDVETKSRDHYCESKAGTGPNAAGNWCEDAENGNCLLQLQVKSY